MARALLKLATILSLIFSILLASSTQITLSSDIEDDDEVYVLDTRPENFRPKSRFLASVVKKGTRCNTERNNVCNGVSANKGTSLIYCCKKHCRNVLGDRNNCGICARSNWSSQILIDSRVVDRTKISNSLVAKVLRLYPFNLKVETDTLAN
ncbi:hypothetical protein SADUNF_Sadunf16G0263100 [Salix dunnii]|uniref:Uncharacterized protein n=1 Tax=Salix dunnii TaxID=1413687 RepID=A0A835MK38_9ROSI|nr:hypothetical protein SADUNF_Sadunf16G0263100 [Salix dunnii]